MGAGISQVEGSKRQKSIFQQTINMLACILLILDDMVNLMGYFYFEGLQ